jgi:hypothetical protein
MHVFDGIEELREEESAAVFPKTTGASDHLAKVEKQKASLNIFKNDVD